MSNFGNDARNSVLERLTRTAASEIIKKINNWVTVEPARASKRWSFELAQNALDASHGREKQIDIEIERHSDEGKETLVFKHNGGPFTHEEICGLIYGGSTKRDAYNSQSDYIGRFGRGKIVTFRARENLAKKKKYNTRIEKQ